MYWREKSMKIADSGRSDDLLQEREISEKNFDSGRSDDWYRRGRSVNIADSSRSDDWYRIEKSVKIVGNDRSDDLVRERGVSENCPQRQVS